MRLAILLLLVLTGALSALDTISVTAVRGETAESSATLPAIIRLSRGTATGTAVTIDLAIGGNATVGADYSQTGATIAAAGTAGTPAAARTHTATIGASASSVDIVVTPIDDSTVELAEAVTVTIIQSAAYQRSPTFFAEAILADDDMRLIWEPIKTNPSEVFSGETPIEGAVRLRFQRVADDTYMIPPGEVKVAYRTLTGTGIATLGTDYALTTMALSASRDPDAGSILTYRSVYWNATTETWSLNARTAVAGSKDDLNVSILFDPFQLFLEVDDIITFGDARDIYRIDSINHIDLAAGTADIDLDRGLVATVSKGAAVRNQQDTLMATNGSSEKVELNASYPILDLAITPKVDAVIEGAENVDLQLLASPDYVISSPSTISVQIADDDMLASIEAVRDAVRNPVQNGQVTIHLNGPTPKAISIPMVITGSAVADTDYTALTTPAVIAQGADHLDIDILALTGGAEGTVTIALVDGSPDYQLEGNGPSPGATATINLYDGATPPPPDATVSLSVVTANVRENSSDTASFLLSAVRSGTDNPTIDVPLLVGGSALPTVDYATLPATISLPSLAVDQNAASSATYLWLRTLSGTLDLVAGETFRVGTLSSTFTVKTPITVGTTAVTVELTAAVGSNILSGTTVGMTSRLYTITTIDDVLAEGDETIALALIDQSTSNNFQLGATTTATMKVLDNERSSSSGPTTPGKPLPSSGGSTGGGCGAGGAAGLLIVGLALIGLRRRRSA